MRVALHFLIISIAILGVGNLSDAAEATQCNDIYPDARIGPPPEWTFWGDGSACFVRWVPENSAHEEQLLERCRTTKGARFVHFERSKGTGDSICIYKVADVTRAFADITRTFSAGARDELLQSEPGNSHPGRIPTDDAENALSTPVGGLAVDSEVMATEPAAPQLIDPDPNRVAATAVCSSTALGDYKHCLGPAQSAGENQFSYSLRPGCTAGSIAAVSTLDDKGHCVRRVILLKGKTPIIVQSYGGSRVIDAIAFQDGVHECYVRRHENVSCDGRTDYDDPKPAVKSTVAKRLPSKQPSNAKKSRPKIEAAAAVPQNRVNSRKPLHKQVKQKKSPPKQEAALSATRNYTNKNPAAPKPKTSKSFKCVLFFWKC